jgi:ABC-type Fe3+/spermidine/putrescine transport system ATPase subunit
MAVARVNAGSEGPKVDSPTQQDSGLSTKPEHLVLRDVHQRYGTTRAVNGVSLTVGQGEFFCMLGPSGSGKTTLLNLIGGLLRPTHGTIHLAGRDITRVAMQRRDIGIVFQNYALFPHLTVAANIAFGLRARRVSRATAAAQVERLLDLVRLPGKGGRYPKQLSGGEQQRVAIARALAISPSLLLLDEPLSNLDAKLRSEMQEELRRVQRDTGVTMILVTHSQEEAFAMGDRVALMQSGSLMQVGKPEDLYARPANMFAMSFIGESNRITGSLIRRDDGPYLAASGSYVAVPDDTEDHSGEVTMMVRPEHMDVSAQQPSDRYTIVGTITEVSYRGAVWRYLLQTTFGPITALHPATADYRPLTPGTDAHLSWHPRHAYLLPSGR